MGILQVVADEIKDFIDSNGTTIGASMAAVVAVAGVGALLALLAALAIILLLLLALIAAIQAQLGPRLGNTLNDVKDTLLNRTDPDEKAAGLLAGR